MKSLGMAGRTTMGSTRITGYEEAYLRRRYGTVAAGLRAAIDKMLPDSVNHPGRAVREKNVISQQDALFSDKPSCGPRMQDHPGWNVVGHGTKTKTVIKSCRICGHQVTEKE